MSRYTRKLQKKQTNCVDLKYVIGAGAAAAATFALWTVYYFYSRDFYQSSLGNPNNASLLAGCENMTVVSGNWKNASVILLGENYDNELETMHCMLSMMTALVGKQFAVFFEGTSITSKEAFLHEVRNHNAVFTPLDIAYKDVCKKSDTCESLYDEQAYQAIETLLHKQRMRVILLKQLEHAINQTQEIQRSLSQVRVKPELRVSEFQLFESSDNIPAEYCRDTFLKLKHKIIHEIREKMIKTGKDVATVVLKELQKIQKTSPLSEFFNVNMEKCDSIFKIILKHIISERIKTHENFAWENTKRVAFFKAGDHYVNAIAIKQRKNSKNTAILLQRRNLFQPGK